MAGVAEFFRLATSDTTNLLGRFLDALERDGVAYCLVDGHAVNAYAEPLMSRDIAFAIAPVDLDRARLFLRDELSAGESALRIEIAVDPRYADFVTRAERREVLGRPTMVAAIDDLLRGKVWAASDPQRRPSKRQKDLADISRILEAYPHLRSAVPDAILLQLIP